MASANLPAIASGFVRKLYSILNGHHAAIIDWNEMGTAFTVFDIDLLVERVLPLYFRGRLDAFRQQLREHGFQRVASSHSQGLLSLSAETYRHVHFLRGNPNALSSIVRTPLPRKRTRRKKPAANVAIKMEVKTEPNVADEPMVKLEPLTTPPTVSPMEDVVELKYFAGNSPNPLFSDDERFDILQWLELPAVDATPSLSSSLDSVEALDLLLAEGEVDGVDGGDTGDGAVHLTDDQIDLFVRLLTVPSVEHGAIARTTMAPPCVWDGGHQFSEDTLHSMVEWFSTVPTT